MTTNKRRIWTVLMILFLLSICRGARYWIRRIAVDDFQRNIPTSTATQVILQPNYKATSDALLFPPINRIDAIATTEASLQDWWDENQD